MVYQEVLCRSALNRVEGMPFGWTLNPYRGCTHGCHFCFARKYQSQLGLGHGDQFSSVVIIKTNFAEVLTKELRRPRWNPQRDLIVLGTATDPYQPIEGRYRLTRQALSALIAHPTPLGIITRGPLAVRDVDLLAALSRLTRCTVTFSVPTVDDVAWHRLEPGTAHPLQRLRAVRRLCRAGYAGKYPSASYVERFHKVMTILKANRDVRYRPDVDKHKRPGASPVQADHQQLPLFRNQRTAAVRGL